MSRRLIAYVHVDGQAYGPGDDVPAEVAERIGAHAWADDTDGELIGEHGPETVGFAGPRADGSGGDVEAPPRSGRGSGIDAWRSFLADHEVGVDADASREDMIAAAEQAGLVEPEPPKE
ncbi:hypothetical protein [Streptomyces zaomyceticus]|uniref:hypothetical protein n=1 Tax=Streptomyces zaomyceticus TaxID=68286 RepID=UPI002E119587|nr:hypothetical protein OG237_15910 [Streptomyces zaomyceticus]